MIHKGRITLVSQGLTMPVDLLPALTGEKTWHTAAWGPRHRLVVMLHSVGRSNGEIAELTGYTKQTVSNVLNDPRAAYEMQDLAERVAEVAIDPAVRLSLLSNEALDEIVEEMRTARDPRVRQKAAFGILDRAGYAPAKKDEARAAPTLPADVIERMEETTKELVSYDVDYKIVEPVPSENGDASD